jgi:hypothetical protein
MRRSLAPWFVFALIGLLGGITYRYLADDPSEGTIANYMRSAVHGVGLALSGWGTHLYFTSGSSEWVRKWPLAVEVAVRSVAMATVVATIAAGLQAALYGARLDTSSTVAPSLVRSCAAFCTLVLHPSLSSNGRSPP